MGMFKDLKKMSDQGKEMQKAQGKPTGMMGMLKDLPNQVSQASSMVDGAMADMQKQQTLMATGTPGRGTIKNFTDTGTLVNHNPQVVLDLEVTIEGQDPYAAQLTTAVPQIYLAKLTPGGNVGVRVDPADPSSLVIDWAQP